MKDLFNKLLPLIGKFSGKKPIVIILSIVAIAAGLFAVQKGYISEESLNFDAIIEVVGNAFADAPADNVITPIDSLSVQVVDSAVNQ